MIRGESEGNYWKWFTAFAEERQPEGLFDWLEVRDLAIKQWEWDRLQRCNSALIEGVLFEALKNLLRPLCMPLVSDGISSAARIAYNYYLGDDEEREQAREKVEAWGITDDQILAEAMQMRAKELVVFDRMDSYRENSKRAHRKSLDRRSEARRNRSDQPDSRQ